MTLSPEQAWQSALGQLQMEMPKASFDTWVRDTRLVTYQNGLFTIGVRNAYAREWLESRLTSTVTRLMTGIMDRDIEVSFVVDNPAKTSEDGDETGAEAEPETTEVQVVHRLRYDDVVLPERIVALPGYFSRLVPEIGARNAWLYVGWRQAVWDGRRQDNGSKTRRVPVREIIRFSGLSRRTFFRAVEEPSTWQALSGLVERCEEKPRWTRGKDRRAHRLPNNYTVHMTLPLSCADAASVQDWLKACLNDGMPLLDALGKAAQIQDLVGEILPPAGLPSTDSSPDIPRTVMEIASQLAGVEGKLPPDLQEASEVLHRKIISAFGTILLTHYFLETVIPNAKLTPPQAWLVALLRDRCYLNRDTGEVRDEVLVRGGYEELAGWLGLNRSKTVWEWIRDDKGPVNAFMAVLPSSERDDATSLRLRVRLEEPIFNGASDTIRLAQVAPLDGADDTIKHGANDTHRMAEMAPLDGAVGTLSWREWHGLKHLNTAPNTQERITPTTQDTPAAAPVSWNLRKIFIQARVHPKVTKDLLAKSASVQAFVSWLLYACSSSGEGIKNPLAYALASLREDPARGPGGAYDRLAALPPAELVRLVRWSIKRASNKYDFEAAPSGNELWNETMGASERHGILLAILLGEEDDSPTIEHKVTQVFIEGEEVHHETETTCTSKTY
jgi:hypothetical protein